MKNPIGFVRAMASASISFALFLAAAPAVAQETTNPAPSSPAAPDNKSDDLITLLKLHIKCSPPLLVTSYYDHPKPPHKQSIREEMKITNEYIGDDKVFGLLETRITSHLYFSADGKTIADSDIASKSFTRESASLSDLVVTQKGIWLTITCKSGKPWRDPKGIMRPLCIKRETSDSLDRLSQPNPPLWDRIGVAFCDEDTAAQAKEVLDQLTKQDQ